MSAQQTAEAALKLCYELLDDRGDVEAFVRFLTLESDFFIAPASTKFHAAFSGGLFLHSWGVYKRLQMFLKRTAEDIKVSAASQLIAGLFHDLCKTGLYAEELKWSKKGGKWIQTPQWAADDSIPLGHGEKSLYLLQMFLQISPEEACAIRFHSNKHETGTHFYYPTGVSLNQALEKFPLTKYVHLADLFQTYGYEKLYSIYHEGEWIDRTRQPFKAMFDGEILHQGDIPY